MTEQRTSGSSSSSSSSGSSSSPLQTERGNTTIQDSVVSKVAGIAAQEVEGIRMGGGASQAVSGILGSITGGAGGSQTQGVSVEVGQEEAAVDLTLTAAYGKSIPQLAEAVRRNVVNRVESLVGLRVTEVNITVANIFFPEQEAEQERQRQLEQQRQQQEAEQQQRVQ
ncbi:MAG: Asp23/Gls24 family envelope stress response protein [Actinomycetes bacterium]